MVYSRGKLSFCLICFVYLSSIILLDSQIHAFLLNRRVLLVSLVSIQVIPASLL